MKLKSIIFVMSCLLVLGVSANVFAVTDTLGESASSVPLQKNVDIASASVQIYDFDAGGYQFAKLGVKMNAGSHLPGIIVFDFDVDNDTTTGGGSIITSLPSSNCGGQVCKPEVGRGFDYFIALVLRTQADTASLANCANCTGGAKKCGTRGAPVNCGTDGTCYPIASSCTTGPNCWVTEDKCLDNGCSSLYTYPMDVLCDDAPTPSCARGLTKAEYFVGYGPTGTVMNGIIELNSNTSVRGETEICVTVPWAIIKTEASIRIGSSNAAHPQFDTVYTINNPPKFQVTALFDYPDLYDGDDFLKTGFDLAALDWMPDTAYAADGIVTDEATCEYNQNFDAGAYGDVDVDGGDLADFLQQFGRGFYDRPCPGCTD